MRSPSVPLGLKNLYRKKLGRRDWLRSPPKRVTRRAEDRAAYEAEAPDRAAEIARIEEDLPHIAYVIRLYEPDWVEGSAKPIRPKKDWSQLPPNGWTAAALDVLREAEGPLTIAEIVKIASDRYDLDVSSVSIRQKAHTAVNNGLKGSYSALLLRHPGRPERFELARD